MSKDKDTQLIWESYQNNIVEFHQTSDGPISETDLMDKVIKYMSKLVNQGSDINDVKKHVLTYLKSNANHPAYRDSAPSAIEYIESGNAEADLEREDDVPDIFDDMI